MTLRRFLAPVVATAIALVGLAIVPSTAQAAPAGPEQRPAGRTFDLQAHRGGRGEYTEESLYGFGKALDLGVSTLELDIVLTKDKQPLIWHDPKIDAKKCADTAPATPGDPMFPYVGKLVHELTYAQVRTLTCNKKLSGFPRAVPVQGNKIARLGDLFALAARRKAAVKYNIETKIEGEKRGDSATPQEFVDTILAAVDAAGQRRNVMIQSFDWRSLPLVHQAAPEIPLVALWDETTWKPGSAWLGPVDYQAAGGDPIVGATSIAGVKVLSPGYVNPYPDGDVPAAGYRLVADRAFVQRAHRAGVKVIPWTINDPQVMTAQIDAGADGIITDYPTRLRALMALRGMRLPSN